MLASRRVNYEVVFLTTDMMKMNSGDEHRKHNMFVSLNDTSTWAHIAMFWTVFLRKSSVWGIAAKACSILSAIYFISARRSRPWAKQIMTKTVWLHTGKQWVNMYIDEQCGSLEDEKLNRLMRKCMCIQMKRHRDTTKSNKSNFFLSLYKDCLMLCNWWFWRKKMNTYDPYLLNTNCNILDIAPLQKQHKQSLYKLPFQMKHNLICPCRSLLRM